MKLKLTRKDILLALFFKGELALFILLCCLTFALSGQGVTQMEFKFQNLNHSLETEQVKLDSLNTIHNKMISKINSEKQNEFADEDEIADLFFRLNNGTPLSPAEVRNSMPGVVTTTIREKSKHKFWKCTKRIKHRGNRRIFLSLVRKQDVPWISLQARGWVYGDLLR